MDLAVIDRSSAARAKSSWLLSTASSAFRTHSAAASSFSFCFLINRCWSARAIATCVLTCKSWFCMSRITCLIIFSGSSALSIKSFRFARISVATRSKSAMVLLLYFRLISNSPDLAEQLRHLHAAQSFKQRRNLRGDLRHVAGDLVHAGGVPVARRNNGDLVDVRERRGQRSDDFGQAGDQLIDHGRLVPCLVGDGLDVHRLGFGFAFLEDDLGLRLALGANGAGMAFGFRDQALPLGRGQRFDAQALHF